ncbi:MAG: tetratricopeptide repeat protein [Blastochloris sp.]|nr:tetratricopeptide repeat protein [Blastochloris sp.]
MAKNDTVRARVEFRNALQQKDDMIAAWRALAQIEEAASNYKALAPIWRKIADLDPKDIETRQRLIKLMLVGGALDEALKLADATIEIDPENANSIALKSGILLKLGDAAAAAVEARRALGFNPNTADALVVLAAGRYSQNDAEGALAFLAQVPEAQKNDVGIALLRIKIYEKLGDQANIEHELRTLVSLHPKEQVFRTELLRFLIANKRQDDAEKELRAVAVEKPEDVNAAMQLIAFLQAIKGPDAVREELEKRIKAGGTIFPFQLTLAELDFAQGKRQEAMQALESIIQATTSPENAATARLKLAEMQMAGRNIAAAEALIGEVLTSDNRNVNALRLRAAIRIEQKRLEDAIADLRRALNEQPKSPPLLTLLAVAYERSGSFELADKQLNDATREANFAPNVGLPYIAFLQRRGNLAHAEDVLSEMVQRNPGNRAVLEALAQVRLQRQNWVGAQDVAERLRKLGENRGVSDQIQAAALTGQQKYDDAIGILQNAYTANPDNQQPMVAIVRTYMLAKQLDKAEAFLQDILKNNPANSDAYLLLGSTQLAGNAPDKAAESFKAAINNNPKSVAGYRALIDLLANQKKASDALDVVQAGLKELPDNFALRLARAELLERQNDYEAAISQYEAILKDQPDALIIANNLASLLSDHRSDKESIERAHAVAEPLAKSNIPQFKDTIGWIYYLRGDIKAAIPLLEEAAAGLPNVALVRYHLGMAYRAAGEAAKAAEQFDKALELIPDKTGGLADKIRAALKG